MQRMHLVPLVLMAAMGCKSRDSSTLRTYEGETLASEGQAAAAPAASQPSISFWARGGKAYRGTCTSNDLASCQVLQERDIATVKQRIELSYLEHQGKSALDQTERGQIDAAAELLRTGFSASGAPDVENTPYAPLGASPSAFLYLDRAFAGAPVYAQPTRLAASGANLTSGSFISETAIIYALSSVHATPVYALYNVAEGDEIVVDLSGCDDQGWGLLGVNVATTGNPFVGPLKRVGFRRYASNVGNTLSITHIQFTIAAKATALVPSTCYISASME